MRKELAQNIGLTIGSLTLVLVALELSLRAYHVFAVADLKKQRPEHEEQVSTEIVCGCSFLYRLNPEHPEVSSQGLRDREYSIPKPGGVFRILMLGDSVTYGAHVGVGRTFSKQLERILNAGSKRPVEVLNAGVSGYTTYNELYYYLDEGRRFEPDVVILVFVMNDVVNPRLHWNYTKEAITEIPPESIPNPEYDRTHVLPLLVSRRYPAVELGSELIGLVARRLDRLFTREQIVLAERHERWPTHLTGEDSISIKVLMDADSAEMKWLRQMFERLESEVSRDGAELLTVLMPLEYQLDPDYPYLPQTLLLEACGQRGAACLDLLEPLRRRSEERLFVGEGGGIVDVWHLTDRGHEVVAEEISKYLRAGSAAFAELGAAE